MNSLQIGIKNEIRAGHGATMQEWVYIKKCWAVSIFSIVLME